MFGGIQKLNIHKDRLYQNKTGQTTLRLMPLGCLHAIPFLTHQHFKVHSIQTVQLQVTEAPDENSPNGSAASKKCYLRERIILLAKQVKVKIRKKGQKNVHLFPYTTLSGTLFISFSVSASKKIG